MLSKILQTTYIHYMHTHVHITFARLQGIPKMFRNEIPRDIMKLIHLSVLRI
jgi:hypothetical protein